VKASRHSIPKGDVVLCNLPPYSTQPWLSMGVVVHYALLARAGIRARVVRPIDSPFLVPPSAAHASLVTFTFDPSMDERMAAMENAYRVDPRFFDAMVDELLAGPEEVIGLSLFRNSADVSLWVARLVKERRPACFIVLGGPEAIEEPTALLLPWIDAVIGADAEAVVVEVARAFLDRRPERCAALRNVHLNPALGVKPRELVAREPSEPPPFPTIDYEPLMPLFVGDIQPTVPMLLNWGCPHSCGFCSNRSIYSRFTAGSTDRVIEEMDAVASRWRALHDGSFPQLTLQLSDATTNALPSQLDDLFRAVSARRSRWGTLPFLRGQVLFDTRITEERVRLMAEANFFSMFFGLDGASDELRRSLKKPASVEQVHAAMEVYHRGGNGGLSFGMPVGIPGETESDFLEAERFVERALALEGTIDTITVLPYLFTLTAQDPELAKMNRGARRGVMWRADVPGGDPAERGARMMRLFEKIDRRVPTSSPLPPYLLLPAMLPGEDPARLDAWMDRFGREFDQITPVTQQEGRVKEKKPAPAVLGPSLSRAERAIPIGWSRGGWVMEATAQHANGASHVGVVALFRHASKRERAAILIEAHDPSRKAFARTRDFNVSYLVEWQGAACAYDGALVKECVRALAAAEAEGA
jgi:radical SAM superfamily enzyme YgiQ (UPF0313 family)